MYDEAIDVTDADEVQSLSPKSPDSSYHVDGFNAKAPIQRRPQSARRGLQSSRSVSKMRHSPEASSRQATMDSDMSENSEDDEEDDDDDVQAVLLEGSYDPKEFEHLAVSPEMKELFEYITFYTPQNIELEYKLQPFVPEYIPAVGDIDGFLKISRPDGVDDKLGLVVLDEPCAEQSDPAVMHLQLRASSKQSSAKPLVVKKVENADKNPKAIEKWIKDISELHKSKPSPTFNYTRPMPDIDSLMQEWPPEFEQKLNEVGLPLEDLDVDLLTLVDIICVLFDVPCYESKIESLHVLFSLYSAIKNYKKDEQNAGEN